MALGKRVIHNYSEDALADALRAIREQSMGIRQASREFGVPRGSLQDRLHGRVKEGPRKMGPSTVLSEEEERKLVQWLVNLAKSGFPRKNEELLNSVQQIIKSTKRETPFNDDRPGKKWYASFMKRHPELVQRTPESLTKGRAIITEESIRKWFKDLDQYLEEINAKDILQDPNRILNGDETSFSLCPKTGKVIAPKGWKDVYEVKLANEKETITVLLVFTASGKTLFPMVVFPYVRPPREVIDSIPENWFLGRSESGWMKSEIFFEYVANGVNKWLEDEEVPKPVILFVDGHKSHLTLELSEFCSNNGIILCALPPNTTHLMQPADVSVFKPLKSEWKKTVREWQYKPENVNTVLTKSTFCPLLATVLDNPSLQIIQNGFRKCGLYPFQPDSVDYSKCVQNKLETLSSNNMDAPVSLNREQVHTAEIVISFLRPQLLQKGINTDDILEELKKTKNLICTTPTCSRPFTDVIDESVTSDNSLYLHTLDIADMEIMMESELPLTMGESAHIDTENGRALCSASSTMGGIEQRYTEENQVTPVKTCEDEHMLVGNEVSPTARLEHNEQTLAENYVVPLVNTENIEPISEEFKIHQITCAEDARHIPEIPVVISVEKDGRTTPSPFKKHLFYPKPITNIKNKVPKEKAPSAISSQKWRAFMKSKEQAKLEETESKRKRKAEREQKNSNKGKKKKKGPLSMENDEEINVNEPESENQCVNEEPRVPRIWKFGKLFPHVRPIGKTEELRQKVHIDDWLLISFNDDKPNARRFFIGKVIRVNSEGYEGTFLRPKMTRDHSGYVYGFPTVIDEYPFKKGDIVGRLENPTAYGRGLYKFNINHKDIQTVT